MMNPFERPDADYLVLRNDRGQHSLWPADNPVPAGWHPMHGPAPRTDCLDYVRQHWHDVRPAEVAEFIAGVTR